MHTYVKPRPKELANALDAQNMSLKALADRADISKATAGFLRQGKKNTHIDKAERVAQALNAPIDDLFTHKNGDPIQPQADPQ